MTANRASVLPVSHRLGAESPGFQAEMSSPPLALSERRAESDIWESTSTCDLADNLSTFGNSRLPLVSSVLSSGSAGAQIASGHNHEPGPEWMLWQLTSLQPYGGLVLWVQDDATIALLQTHQQPRS